MKNIRIFLSENLQFLVMRFSIYLNRRVFVMVSIMCAVPHCDVSMMKQINPKWTENMLTILAASELRTLWRAIKIG